MIVSSPLFDAYLECDTKCWLRARAEPGTGNIYAEWVRLKNETYCEEGASARLQCFLKTAARSRLASLSMPRIQCGASQPTCVCKRTA